MEFPTLYIRERDFPADVSLSDDNLMHIKTMPSSMKALQRYQLIWHRKRDIEREREEERGFRKQFFIQFVIPKTPSPTLSGTV